MALTGGMSAAQKQVVQFFVVFLLVYYLESIGGFYMTTAVVSIEKHFQIPSKVSGTMVSAGDFGYIPSVVFVAYLGGKGNRARWIGVGCMLIAVANLLIGSSNFVFTSETQHQADDDLNQFDCSSYNATNNVLATAEEIMNCDPDYSRVESSLLMSSFAYCDARINRQRLQRIEESCVNKEMVHFGPTAMIFGGLFILGIGRTMPFSLGLPLVDDNVKKANLPVYFAGMFLIRLLGPICGFGMGTFFNKYYYKFETPVGLTPVDPDWIGRWWAGFFLIGVILFFPSLLLAFFPKPVPADENGVGLALVDRHVRRNSQGKAHVPHGLTSKVKDFWATISAVLKNPVYTGCMIGRIMDVFTFKGFFVFLPKYLEVQFGIPQYMVNKYMSFTGVLGFAIGVGLGTVVMRFFKLEGRKAATWVACCSALAAGLSFINATVGCESTTSALAMDLTAKTNLSLSCLGGCSCNGMPMFPVCDSIGQVYYSPCHAGCPVTRSALENFIEQPEDSVKQGIVFDNCLCTPVGDSLRRVSRQLCLTENCDAQVIKYFVFMALGGMVGGLGVTPGVLILLRSVPPIHRSISLGFNGFLVSLLATLPSPIFWGYLIDKFCVQWDNKCDAVGGSCSLYDAHGLRVWLHVANGTLRMFSLFTDVFVIYHAKNLKLTEEETDEDDDNDQAPNGKQDIKLEALNDTVDPLLGAPGEKKHRRTPSGGVQTKIAAKMDAEDDFQQARKLSLAHELIAAELPQHGSL